ncbi:hypothetical protein GCM10027321_35630 [Massilia terrae]|uniref:DUF3016 domain-containing protein n=1 Tax=Massilia terrae TaxID=1811224 RepID=A0ABT2D432_9BURK|nr:DUF3016 domain-containing protein [Massilia terrae]MCS0661001.1 DUF3016 domain-containing protein [Massilia terrae]
MKTPIRQMAFAGLCLLSATSAFAAEVTVHYVQPDKFADMPFEPWEREDVMKQLTEHFAKLGQRLPSDQTLTIDVLDIDLAGRVIPNTRSGRDLRIMKGEADWPHMRLRYSLQQGGNVVASGDADISDMAYMMHLNRYSDGDPLRFEKQMLDEWFEKTFLGKRR